MVREGRDGAEKGRALGEKTDERKEKQEGKDNHNQDEKAAGWIVMASQQCIAHMQSPWLGPLRVLQRDGRKQSEERREKRSQERQPYIFT